jgi:hypothetical protein
MRTEEEMRMVMEVLKESGLSKKAFAEREGIPFSVVQYWRGRLKKLDRLRTKAAKPEAEFVPVKIVDRASVATEPFEPLGATARRNSALIRSPSSHASRPSSRRPSFIS